MIQLTDEQTMLLFWNQIKNKTNKNRYKYSSKSQWKCLNCGTNIFVSYLIDNTSSIYCNTNENCRSLKIKCSLHPNLVEVNYFRILKEEHHNIIINNYGKDENNGCGF